MSAKICFITAIYGNYEASCKRFVQQTIPADFICFSDSHDIISNGWKVDTTPYHLLYPSPVDQGTQRNSMKQNKHTFNIAKYYKQSFRCIPILQSYDTIVWLDGTIEIIDPTTSEYITTHIHRAKIIGWHHEWRYGILHEEVKASHFARYTSVHWNGQDQPYQDIDQQYNEYVEDGYNDQYFKNIPHHTPHLGVWITCFVAFLQHDPEVISFLDLWYQQTLTHTTQDQIGFPYVCQKLNMIPHTLPNETVKGDRPHDETQFYIKHQHGK
jgi:hypothetical protein